MKRIPRRIFTAEFKKEAIQLVTQQGLTMAEASRKLDIAPVIPPFLASAKSGGITRT